MTLSPSSWPGSGSGVGPSCVLNRGATIDVHAVGVYPVSWDQLVDDIWNQTILGSLPAGLGLTASFDGSSPLITTTAAGVWAFTLQLNSGTGADATIRGEVLAAYGGDPEPFGPVQVGGQVATLSTIYSLPSGATSQVVISTRVAAAANPYNMVGSLGISRLA